MFTLTTETVYLLVESFHEPKINILVSIPDYHVYSMNITFGGIVGYK